MAVDKLVDSTQLDANLTSVADAIRAKGGTSAQLPFPAGFVSAIGDIPSGGSAMQSGSITLASDVAQNGNLVVPLSGAISHFVFFVDTFPSSESPDGWQTVGGVWFNSFGWSFIRYNDANYSAGQDRAVNATASAVSYNVQYKIPAGTTIHWFGW